MADYRGYEPRTFDDDLEDLAIVGKVLEAYQVIVSDRGPRDSEDRLGRAHHALMRVKKGIEGLKARDAMGRYPK